MFVKKATFFALLCLLFLASCTGGYEIGDCFGKKTTNGSFTVWEFYKVVDVYDGKVVYRYSVFGGNSAGQNGKDFGDQPPVSKERFKGIVKNAETIDSDSCNI